MIRIAHRGNTLGPSELENRPDYLLSALEAGFDVEADIRLLNGNTYYLGHDGAQYDATDFLVKADLDRVWFHAKDPATFAALLRADKHCFFHDRDAVALTSWGYLWTYPGEPLVSNSVCVLPREGQDLTGAIGVCSDYVGVP